ncbi:MAG: hypothetical protein H7328_08415 [Bdellovibrio sp.]|nr:hypothetical protein [Bdellovibrio sp.]
MKLVAIILAFIGSSAFASADRYDLQMDLYLNGKHISSPNANVKAGEITTITQKIDTKEISISFLANLRSIQKIDLIWMPFSVRIYDLNGQVLLAGDHQIYAKENEQMNFTVGNNGDEVSLSVTAKKESL